MTQIIKGLEKAAERVCTSATCLRVFNAWVDAADCFQRQYVNYASIIADNKDMHPQEAAA